VWWNTLHQAASVSKLARPSIAPEMLVPLILMFLGFNILFGAVLFTRVRGEVLQRERSADWIRAVLSKS
jgi:heme exporter protein C